MGTKSSFPTQQEIRDKFSYDKNTGLFTRITVTLGRKIGSIAGGKNAEGYWYIRINEKGYTAHRLAWVYVYGENPDGDIDHINGNRSDNRIENLRVVTRSVNLQNQRKKRNGSQGQLGVKQVHKRFEARITVGGKRKYLGLFKTEDDAYAAYVQAKRVYHAGCTI